MGTRYGRERRRARGPWPGPRQRLLLREVDVVALVGPLDEGDAAAGQALVLVHGLPHGRLLRLGWGRWGSLTKYEHILGTMQII